MNDTQSKLKMHKYINQDFERNFRKPIMSLWNGLKVTSHKI